MLNMKKDMGGAAAMLALAHMLMDRGPKIRLRVLIPAVENAISGSAFRPRDIYRSRKGLTVEIGNTDAEGRLILADALALADEEEPELIADMATLTGAARVALGTEVPPFYTDDDELASTLARCAASENDPLWRMPLWRPYEQLLDSKVADINNVASGGFRRLDHRRAVPAPLRHRAPRRGCIAISMPGTRPTQARPARRRRVPGGARALCAAGGALWLSALARGRCARPAPHAGAARSRGKASRRQGRCSPLRRRASSTRSASRRRRCAARPRPTRRSIPRRSRASASPSTRSTRKAGPGASSKPTAMWASCPRARCACPARRRPIRSRRCARWSFPALRSSFRRSKRSPLGAGSRSRAIEGPFAVTASGGYVPARHLAPLESSENRFRRRRGALPRRALSVGRQDQPRPRLLRAACRSRSPPAGSPCPRDSDMQEQALGDADCDGPTSPPCSAATCCSGKATSPSCAIKRRSSTPTPSTWRSRSSRSREAIARIRAAGSEVTSIRRLERPARRG